jgi:hypothetical protein
MYHSKYGVYNTDRDRMVTRHNGAGVFNSVAEAEELKEEMGGLYDSHLTVVEISEVEDNE